MNAVVRLYDSVREPDACSPLERVTRTVGAAHALIPSSDVCGLSAHFHILQSPPHAFNFLSFWKLWDDWPGLAIASGSGEESIVQGMRELRDGVLGKVHHGSIRTADLRSILEQVMVTSDEPSYWRNVLAALPSSDVVDERISIEEVSDAVHVWLVDFLGVPSVDNGDFSAPSSRSEKSLSHVVGLRTHRSSSLVGTSGLELMERLAEYPGVPAAELAMLQAFLEKQEQTIAEHKQNASAASHQCDILGQRLKNTQHQLQVLQEEFGMVQTALESSQQQLSEERVRSAAVARRCHDLERTSDHLQQHLMHSSDTSDALQVERLQRRICELEVRQAKRDAAGSLLKGPAHSQDVQALVSSIGSFACLADEEAECCAHLWAQMHDAARSQTAAAGPEMLRAELRNLCDELHASRDLLELVEVDDPAGETPRHRSLARSVAFYKLQIGQILQHLAAVDAFCSSLAESAGLETALFSNPVEDLSPVFAEMEERLYTMDVQKVDLENDNFRLQRAMVQLQSRVAAREKGLTASTWAGDDEMSSDRISVPACRAAPKARPRPSCVPPLPLPLRTPRCQRGDRSQRVRRRPPQSAGSTYEVVNVDGWVQFFQETPFAAAASALTTQVPLSSCGTSAFAPLKRDGVEVARPGLGSQQSEGHQGVAAGHGGRASGRKHRRKSGKDDCHMM